MPSRRVRVPVAAFALAGAFAAWSEPACAQQENEYGAPVDEPRYSVQAAGSLGLGTWLLGTPAIGGSIEGDIWGRRTPVAIGLRAGALASGIGDEAKHGTFYGGAVFTVYRYVGDGRIFGSAMVGAATTHGPLASADSATLTGDIDLRGGYMVPAGPVRLGIALDLAAIPGAGAVLLATPILDIPF